MNFEDPMSAKPRKNELTRSTVHRVYRIGEDLRQAVSSRRRVLGLTTHAFLAEAVEGELPGLVEALRALLPAPEQGARPARLPMTEALLNALRKASHDVGVPATRLLLACLARAAARKRRRPGAAQAPDEGTRKPDRKRMSEKPLNPPEGEVAGAQKGERPENDERDCDADCDPRPPEIAAEAAGEPVSLAIPA
jgi:hypothetical protein